MTETIVVNVKTDEYDVYIGRAVPRKGLKKSKWANPFKVGRDGTRGECVAKYHAWLLNQPTLMAVLHELDGKRLGCWCAPALCHGHLLQEMVNRGSSEMLNSNDPDVVEFWRTLPTLDIRYSEEVTV